MTNLRGNRSFFVPQRMPPVGPESEPAAECGTWESNLSVTHDLLAWLGIMLVSPVDAEMGNQVHGLAQPVRGRAAAERLLRHLHAACD